MKKLYIFLSVILFVICSVLFHRNMACFIAWVHTLGPAAPLAFMLLYCISTLLFIPTMPLVLTGGLLFGPVWGACLSLLSATIGATWGFCISRYWGLNWISSTKRTHIHHLIERIDRHGWKAVMVFRLAPMPFSAVNYGFGLTRIKITHYIVATFVFLIPYKIVVTYLGFYYSH
ncbi:MAG: VTT domain-containing protein [Legionellaceae bacterium]|nr:VTT domain-containing protein [Legionellaceae bacterium]